MFSKSKLLMSASATLLVAAALQSNLACASDVAEVPITASRAGDVHSVIVHYGDLNLRSQTGAAKLYHRIQVAAGRACGSERLTGQFTISPQWSSCVEAAVSDAVADVNRPSVTAFAQSQVASAGANRHSGESQKGG